MSKIILTRGVPGAGKSTFAREWVQEDPLNRIRVNRDELRQTLYGTTKTLLSWQQEQNVSAVEKAIAKVALEKGKDVVVDAMNLRTKWVNQWLSLGHDVEYRDFPIGLEEAHLRNEERGGKMPAEVLEDIFKRYTKDGELPPAPVPFKVGVEHYEPGGIPAYSFDLDGTIALMGDRRSPYDPTKYHLDEPNLPVVETLNALTDSFELFYGADRGRDWAIIGLTGRSEDHREATEKWLKDHDIELDALFMRKTGDNRNDGIVKAELVRDNISGVYDVTAHFDDRNRVVDSLRSIGLPVFQVAEGAF